MPLPSPVSSIGFTRPRSPQCSSRSRSERPRTRRTARRRAARAADDVRRVHDVHAGVDRSTRRPLPRSRGLERGAGRRHGDHAEAFVAEDERPGAPRSTIATERAATGCVPRASTTVSPAPAARIALRRAGGGGRVQGAGAGGRRGDSSAIAASAPRSTVGASARNHARPRRFGRSAGRARDRGAPATRARAGSCRAGMLHTLKFAMRLNPMTGGVNASLIAARVERGRSGTATRRTART